LRKAVATEFQSNQREALEAAGSEEAKKLLEPMEEDKKLL